jgi:hypothetical protein
LGLEKHSDPQDIGQCCVPLKPFVVEFQPEFVTFADISKNFGNLRFAASSLLSLTQSAAVLHSFQQIAQNTQAHLNPSFLL